MVKEGPDFDAAELALLKKLLMLELFKLGVPQAEIGKKLKMNLASVNAFLKGCKKPH